MKLQYASYLHLEIQLNYSNNSCMKHLVFRTKASLMGLLLLSLSSCILTVPKERRACYKELKKFANEHWKFAHNDSILIENEIVFFQARGDREVANCSKQMTTKEIKKIFGTPHEISKHDNGVEGRFYYYTMFCYPAVNKVKICSFYYFNFNTDGVCNSFGAGGVQKSH